MIVIILLVIFIMSAGMMPVVGMLTCVFSESCSRDEFLCDSGRCLLPASVCDGHPNCQDQTDETNCSQKHKGAAQTTWGGVLSSALCSLTLPCPTECGGQRTGPSGYLSSPNHPRNYPHQQVPFFEAERHLLGKLHLAKPGSSVCPLALHLALICGGRSRHHAELQELQPGDSRCLRV